MSKIIYSLIFWIGYIFLPVTKKTFFYSYASLRKLFVLTNGRFNDFVSRLISFKKKKYNDIIANGVLGNLSPEHVRQIAGELEQNGMYIFENVLDENTVKAIEEFARKEPATYLMVDNTKKAKYSDNKVYVDPENPVSPRYEYGFDQIMKCKELESLVFDQSLLAVAQEYLKCSPVLDLVAFWWSLPYKGKGKSEAAQMYHFDMDRIKFIKFFFYLTDVDTDTGPHCYVKSSHKRLPPALLKDGRIEDAEIERAFSKNNMIEICGKRGTIMAVDTRGLHKGKPLTKGYRLLFQIEMANSMFGQYYPPVTIKSLNPQHQNIVKHYRRTYSQIFKFLFIK